MDELKKKIITITGMEAFPVGKPPIGMKVLAGSEKFTMFFTKKDGNTTASKKAWDEQNMNIGSSVGVAYKEEEKKFTNTEGKEITYPQRTIMFFSTPEQIETFNDGGDVAGDNQPVQPPIEDTDISDIPF
jgi:hypothetical protein